MLFFNNRIRNKHISTIPIREPPYTHKLGHSCIIFGCLSIIIGLTLIVIAVIYETKKTALIVIGVISLGIGLFLTILACFYTKLSIYYNNWAYGSHIIPIHIATQQPTMEDITVISPYVVSTAITPRIQTMTALSPSILSPKMSDVKIGKVIIAPSIEIGKTTGQPRPDNLT